MADRRCTIGGYELDRSVLRVHVRGGRGSFTETVDFGVELNADPATHHLARLASVAIATSYAKVEPIDQLAVPSTDAQLAMFTAELFDHGLREYRYRNSLPLDAPPTIIVEDRRWTEAPMGDHPAPFSDRGALVAIGGGKDSALTLRTVLPALAACVNPSPAVRHLCAAAGVELHSIIRRLDPRLVEVNADGGLNGHIPVTAINSALLALLAHQLGHRDVVFANERSAEEPTRVVDGLAVNHQWSKTLAFEELFAAQVEPFGLRYWSVTRGMSDIGVVARVVGDGTLVRDFLSCNRAFRLDDIAKGVDNRGRWCGECDKCAFTFLMFALFLDRSVMTEIFGRDMLDAVENESLFASLATPGVKPFDCVGEIDESRAALSHLATSATWGEAGVVRRLAGTTAGARNVEEFLDITADRVPSSVRRVLDAVPTASLVP